MRKFTYPAVFYKEDGGYSVLFPDFACGTCGSTLEQAQLMAVDFLYSSLTILEEDGKIFPTATDIAKVQIATDFEYESAFVAPICVDIDKYALYLETRNKAVRKNVTVPLWLAEIAEK